MSATCDTAFDFVKRNSVSIAALPAFNGLSTVRVNKPAAIPFVRILNDGLSRRLVESGLVARPVRLLVRIFSCLAMMLGLT